MIDCNLSYSFDVVRNFNFADASGSRRNAFYGEVTEDVIIFDHGTLTFVNGEANALLIVVDGYISLGNFDRNGRVPLDDSRREDVERGIMSWSNRFF